VDPDCEVVAFTFFADVVVELLGREALDAVRQVLDAVDAIAAADPEYLIVGDLR